MGVSYKKINKINYKQCRDERLSVKVLSERNSCKTKVNSVGSCKSKSVKQR